MGRSRRAAGLVVVVVAALPACGGGEAESTAQEPKHPPKSACAAGERPLPDGSCLAAGMQENGCAAGEVALEGGGCRPAGIPAESCAAGFVPTGDDSCAPVLPDEPCPSGKLAVPGDRACVEVAPCGAAPWGDIPTDATTQYVDSAYAGGDSDGSAQKPWTTIQVAVDAAVDNGLVAVAAGSYAEDVLVQNSPVRIWGRCPSMVEIVGSAAGQAAIEIKPAVPNIVPSGTEIRRVGLRGDAYGVFMTGVTDVLIDEVWIHDTVGRGVSVQGGSLPTSASIHGSLVESATGIGVFVAGAEATIEASAIVATRAHVDQTSARALSVRHSTQNGERAKVTVRGSVFERSVGDGVTLTGSDATFESLVIRRMVPETPAMGGRGITAQSDNEAGERSALTMRSSFVEATHQVGVLVEASDATLDAVAIVGTLPLLDGSDGIGLGVQDSVIVGTPSTATVTNSVVSGGHGSGIHVVGSEVALEGVLVHDVEPLEDDLSGGLGIVAIPGGNYTQPARVTARGSRIEGCRAAGVLAIGSDATLEGVAIRDILPRPDNQFGLGVVAQPSFQFGTSSTLTLRSSLIERTHVEGVFVAGSNATIESTLIREISANASDAKFGRGISVEAAPAPAGRATAAVRWSRVADNFDAGIFVIGSSATIEATAVEGTKPRAADGLFGDGIVAHAVLGPTDVTIQGSSIEQSARGGLTSFGGVVSLAGSTLECNLIHLDGEPLGQSGFEFADLGDNVCGCSGTVETCKVQSSSLQPPEASGPAQ